MSRRADKILGLLTNPQTTIEVNDPASVEKLPNDCPNLPTTEENKENQKVNALFETFEGEFVSPSSTPSESSISDLFSSDGEEEYVPDLNDLSSSDNDLTFVKKVTNKIENKKQKRYVDISDEEGIAGSTDSDSNSGNIGFSLITRKYSSKCVKTSEVEKLSRPRPKSNHQENVYVKPNTAVENPSKVTSDQENHDHCHANDDQISDEEVIAGTTDSDSDSNIYFSSLTCKYSSKRVKTSEVEKLSRPKSNSQENRCVKPNTEDETPSNVTSDQENHNHSHANNDQQGQKTEPPRKKQKVFNLPEKKSRKRICNPDTWKRNKAKILRQQGKAYTSQEGIVMNEKVVNEGILCNGNCRFKCNENFNLEQRKEILSSFYKLDVNSKNNLLFRSIVPVKVERPKNNAPKNRSAYQFYVRSNNDDIRVCKKALCSLFQVGVKKIDLLQAKMVDGASAPPSDGRGRHDSRPHKITHVVKKYIREHIQSFPAESSHYSRNVNHYKKYLSPLLDVPKMHKLYLELCELENKPSEFKVKECSYRKVFNRDFNLSFGHPRSDTCCTCDAGENNEEHEFTYKEAFSHQIADREKARTTEKVCYITVDLQQTMPLPRLTTSKAFYLRQLWFYNLGVHIIAKDTEKADFCTWTEDIANRGSSEVASSLMTLFELDPTLKLNTDHLIIWSDSCSGQNKNFGLILLYQYLITKKVYKIIDHKFPVVGHSYLDSDRDFGRIEKDLRKHENIYVPEQYRNIISKASKNNMVVDMAPHFRDFDNLKEKLDLTQRKTDLLGENVRFRDGIKWIRVEEYGSYLFKETYDEYTPFKKVSLKKQVSNTKSRKNEALSAQNLTPPATPKNVRIDRIQKPHGNVTKEKIINLREQMKFVKEEHRWFYEHVFDEHKEKESLNCGT